MDPLKLAVERIVGPIPADETPKNTYRRELYAHARELYALETSRADNDDEAIAAAIRRLGDPEKLRTEFMLSLPRHARWQGRFEHAMSPRPGETMPRFTLRIARWTGTLMVSLVGGVLSWSLLFKDRWSDMLGAAAIVGLIVVVLITAFGVLMGLLEANSKRIIRSGRTLPARSVFMLGESLLAISVLWAVAVGTIALLETALAATVGEYHAATAMVESMKFGFALLFTLAMTVALLIVPPAMAFEHRQSGHLSDWPYGEA